MINIRKFVFDKQFVKVILILGIEFYVFYKYNIDIYVSDIN